MDSGRGKKRMNVEGDRLSYLPDDLIHKILSFINIKCAIETSALSSRWRYIWTSMPCLNFSTKDFHTFTKFSKFVTHVLSRRNSQTEVSSVNLTFHGRISHPFVKRILNKIFNYEFSHNIQQLKIICSNRKSIVSPLSLFSSQSLKHLTLAGFAYMQTVTTTPAWELPNLTTLNLHDVTFYAGNTTDKSDGLFSNFENLKNLTLKHCKMVELKGFSICHPRLSNLTLEDGYEGGNVVTPQLKNLTIRHWRALLVISAPDLASLHYKGYYESLQLSPDFLHLEKANMCISSSSSHYRTDAHKFVCLLQKLHNVKFLTLSLETIKLLSLSVELISHQPSPFVNLKSLKIYPAYVTLNMETQPEVTTSNVVKNYLLDGSPDATFTMVSDEEIRAVKNVTTARNLMRELHALLDEWKGNSETNTAHMKKDKAPKEKPTATMHEQLKDENQPDTIMESHFGERIAHINEQLKKGYNYTDRAISMLHAIEGVLAKLPTSDRAKLKAKFSGLCAEAESVMDIMMDDLKIQDDKKPRLYFHEPAAAS